ncbi:fimbrial protein [Burkholderia sp. ABCPW 14]|uniref:fimbrial protein n=1 Tax=Burkholderia sp. ABCPW 14 TaxID=1637860 RepID=UPI003FA47685
MHRWFLIRNTCRIIPPLTPVHIPDAHVSSFAGPGSESRASDFSVRISSCGNTPLRVRVEPAAGTAPGFPSVARLLPTSGATGVGVFLKWDNGAPVLLGETTTLREHLRWETSDSFSIHLRAGLTQTLPRVGAGPVYAQVRVTVSYD